MKQIKNLIGEKFDYFMLTKTGFKISAGGHTLSIKGKNVASDFAAKLVKGEVITSASISYTTLLDGSGIIVGCLYVSQGNIITSINFYGDL
jgi:hypothetical protein